MEENMPKSGKFLKCKSCQKEVYVQAHRVDKFKFCSNLCYAKYLESDENPLRKRKIVICKECNKEIKNIANYSEKKFCNLQCFGEYQKKRNKEVSLVKKKIETTCLHCGLTYKIWEYRKDTNKFCCMACFDNYRRDFLKCPTCKKNFVAPKNETRKYCSEQCAAKGVLKRRSKFHVAVASFVKNEYAERYVEEKYVKGFNFKHYLDFILDGFINLECDGTYWHCDPSVYHENYYHRQVKATAKEIWEKDRDRDCRLEKMGYTVMRLKEKEWSDDSKSFFSNLKEKIQNIQKGDTIYEIPKNT
jgi:endogenous inhibitor of DNA gyrase (YacG/DUF329 family)